LNFTSYFIYKVRAESVTTELTLIEYSVSGSIIKGFMKYLQFKLFMRVLACSAFLLPIFIAIQPRISKADFFTKLKLDFSKEPGLVELKKHIDDRSVPTETPEKAVFKNANCVSRDIVRTFDGYVKDVRDGVAAEAYKNLDDVFKAFEKYEHKDLILGRADKLTDSFGSCGPGAESQPISSTLPMTNDALLERFLENSELKFERENRGVKFESERPKERFFRRLKKFFKAKVKAGPSDATKFVVAREDLEMHFKERNEKIEMVNKMLKEDKVDTIQLYRGLAAAARSIHFYYNAALKMAKEDHYLPVLKRMNGTRYSHLKYPDLPQLSEEQQKKMKEERRKKFPLEKDEVWSEDKTADFERCKKQLDSYFSKIIEYCEDQITLKQVESLPHKPAETPAEGPNDPSAQKKHKDDQTPTGLQVDL